MPTTESILFRVGSRVPALKHITICKIGSYISFRTRPMEPSVTNGVLSHPGIVGSKLKSHAKRLPTIRKLHVAMLHFVCPPLATETDSRRKALNLTNERNSAGPAKRS